MRELAKHPDLAWPKPSGLPRGHVQKRTPAGRGDLRCDPAVMAVVVVAAWWCRGGGGGVGGGGSVWRLRCQDASLARAVGVVNGPIFKLFHYDLKAALATVSLLALSG